MPQWMDAHCHMADDRIQARLESWITEAESRGIHFFLQGGVGPEDWQKQGHLAKRFPQKIGLCFGLHPYWVADHSRPEGEKALDVLSKHISEVQALGEMGLDFRPSILKEDPEGSERQISFFEMQLELAKVANKPVVLHLVQAHDEALRVLDHWGLPQAGGFVHSFNGSSQKAQDFLERGLFISVGGPLGREKNIKLKQAVKAIPLEKLLIETDSPDQPADLWQGQLNPLSSLLVVAEEVAKIKGISATEVLDISTQNLKQLLQLKEK